MCADRTKYADRAERLVEFYNRKKFDSKVQFAEALGIKKQNVNAYLTGTQDPVNLCEELIELGCDIHWLITGQYASGISAAEEEILSLIKSNSFDIDKLKEAIELYQFAHRKDQPKKEIKQLTAADMMDTEGVIYTTDEKDMIRHRHIRNADTARKHKNQ